MNTYNACGACGVSPFKCKNVYCSGNPNYKGIQRRNKPKQGPGKPAHSTRSKIKVDNSRGYSFSAFDDGED